ncbi:hypothetical protein GWK47_041480 [Chionoecetes opilio]|uniref:Uncharacterized protein n=1 Tax=Chionoecetes opilio TaxID=41210 RepID=A0A8J4YCE1_CHIOP|nr:hypothetical protein GWK47_041480 [Chionoecetes opilio]
MEQHLGGSAFYPKKTGHSKNAAPGFPWGEEILPSSPFTRGSGHPPIQGTGERSCAKNTTTYVPATNPPPLPHSAPLGRSHTPSGFLETSASNNSVHCWPTCAASSTPPQPTLPTPLGQHFSYGFPPISLTFPFPPKHSAGIMAATFFENWTCPSTTITSRPWLSSTHLHLYQGCVYTALSPPPFLPSLCPASPLSSHTPFNGTPLTSVAVGGRLLAVGAFPLQHRGNEVADAPPKINPLRGKHHPPPAALSTASAKLQKMPPVWDRSPTPPVHPHGSIPPQILPAPWIRKRPRLRCPSPAEDRHKLSLQPARLNLTPDPRLDVTLVITDNLTRESQGKGSHPQRAGVQSVQFDNGLLWGEEACMVWGDAASKGTEGEGTVICLGAKIALTLHFFRGPHAWGLCLYRELSTHLQTVGRRYMCADVCSSGKRWGAAGRCKTTEMRGLQYPGYYQPLPVAPKVCTQYRRRVGCEWVLSSREWHGFLAVPMQDANCYSPQNADIYTRGHKDARSYSTRHTGLSPGLWEEGRGGEPAVLEGLTTMAALPTQPTDHTATAPFTPPSKGNTKPSGGGEGSPRCRRATPRGVTTQPPDHTATAPLPPPSKGKTQTFTTGSPGKNCCGAVQTGLSDVDKKSGSKGCKEVAPNAKGVLLILVFHWRKTPLMNFSNPEGWSKRQLFKSGA